MSKPVRYAHIASFAVPYDDIERFKRLVDRSQWIIVVQLVKIDVVRVQPAQRGVNRIEDVLA